MVATIKKIKLINYRRFRNYVIEPNDRINILVGDNEVGKSSVLEAINLVASGNVRVVEAIGLDRLINIEATYIVNSLAADKRSLIITYTNGNYDNLALKIAEKFSGTWPENITLMSYFQFLYRFCYKPFLADRCGARGVIFEANPNRRLTQNQRAYYLTRSGYFYSNRLSLFLTAAGVVDDVKGRIETYFDELIIDEVQDIAGRDFAFLERLMETNVNMLFVGDFFQHTYNTSLDGNVNINLFKDRSKYEKRFSDKCVVPDTTTLLKSWRCCPSVCDYISKNLGIAIASNRAEDAEIRFISDPDERSQILSDSSIIKLHYQNSAKYGPGHKNWGDTKGEDCYQNVCVMLNKETMRKYRAGKLSDLAPSTRNKLYVAITRAHGNVYIVEE